MARSLPVYVKWSTTTVTASSSAPVATAALTYAQGGVVICGATAILASTGGKVTLTIRDGGSLANSPIIYQIEFDFTSVTTTADYQTAPIPCLNDPTYTVQADATANTKEFKFEVLLQKIAIEG